MRITDFRTGIGAICAILVSIALTSTSYADIVISYGTLEAGTLFIDLLPNQAGQAVQFFATGIAAEPGGVNGLELDLQVGDGGVADGAEQISVP